MSGTSQSGNGGSSKRVNDFQDAMMSLPGYADDTMFVIVRYGTKVKDTLRNSDFDAWDKKCKELFHLRLENDKNPVQGEAAVAEYEEKVAARREEALEMIKEFPELVSGFDAYTAATISLAKATRR